MGRPMLYPVALSSEQEQTLKSMTSKGSGKARVMTRARILLLACQQQADLKISGDYSAGVVVGGEKVE